MRIVAPLNRYNEINALIDAGADQLYSGLLDKKQSRRYGNFLSLNRRSEIFSNLNSRKELKRAVGISSLRNVPFIFTLNEYYNETQLSFALDQAQEAIDCGVDNFLVTDIGLILALKEKFRKIKLHLSSCATVFNAEAIRFYLDLGITRIVLHRHLSLREIKTLKSLLPPQLEVEVLILNERCYYLDGYCSFQHDIFTNMLNHGGWGLLHKIIKKYIHFVPKTALKCINKYIIRKDLACCFKFENQDKFGLGSQEDKIIFNTAETFLYACGICSLYAFHNIGISHVKIAGRSILTDQVANVSLVKKAIKLLGENKTEDCFISEVKSLSRSIHKNCATDKCYYFTE